MSRSYVGKRCRNSNKHLNSEVWGRSDYSIGPDDKVFPRQGGEPVGGPESKKYAKTEVSRLRRRYAKNRLRAEVNNGGDDE